MELSGAATVRTTTGRHGVVRGLTLSRRSSQFEGRFGRMFRTLPAAEFDEEMLRDLARAMTAALDHPGSTPEEDQQREEKGDDEENIGTREDPGISAGYTYLGQFIDHDLTFDPMSSLQRQNDPDGLTDFRTPRFDLDCIYGRGPDDQPYLYRADGRTLLLGERLTGNAGDPRARGVPRNTPADGEPARALIGDPRNDENAIVSQLHATMLRFHNRMAALLPKSPFEEIQRQVRWHYQWVVLHDFLPTIIGQELCGAIVGHGRDGEAPHLRFYQPKKQAYIPVEFSVAAYRFGHSMVRPFYRLNAQTSPRIMLFDRTGDSLAGFGAFPRNLGIDWSLFFAIEGERPRIGAQRVQPAYKIDTSLVHPLGRLPRTIAMNPPSLAERNLVRGWRMQLPSGQDVARAMGIEPIPDEMLTVGKATQADMPNNTPITKISKRFAGNAPLWYYILAEAQQQFIDNQTPIHLGAVGGRIVGEVIVGLLLADSHSYLRQHPTFRPRDDFLSAMGDFSMADLLRQALQA
jgi:heme peroxidase